MIKRIFLFIPILAMLATSGIPLAILQFGAWCTMFDEFYEESQSIRLSVKWTFDGEHQCKICQFVNQENRADQEKISSNEITSHKFTFSSDWVEQFVNSQNSTLEMLMLPEEAMLITFISMELPPPRLTA